MKNEERDETDFGTGGMDADGHVEIFFRRSQPDRHGVTLSDFTRVRSQNVKSDHPILQQLQRHRLDDEGSTVDLSTMSLA